MEILLEFLRECDYTANLSLHCLIGVNQSLLLLLLLTFNLQIISNYQEVAKLKTGQITLEKHLPRSTYC